MNTHNKSRKDNNTNWKEAYLRLRKSIDENGCTCVSKSSCFGNSEGHQVCGYCGKPIYL